MVMGKKNDGEYIVTAPEGADRVLLHTCCAPCSSAIIECLMRSGITPTIYYCNPNIYPEEEYLIRKNECSRYAESLGLDIVDADYDHAEWLEADFRSGAARSDRNMGSTTSSTAAANSASADLCHSERSEESGEEGRSPAGTLSFVSEESGAPDPSLRLRLRSG